jgi:GrpB-like predicted nucleotidyltransferase (UPF0157 family)
MPIEIVPYQERWPLEFREVAAGLRAGLGALALRIDHIGSTSVAGLAAKDVLDVQIAVRELDEHVVAALSGLGYRQIAGIMHDHVPPHFAGPENEWAKFFFQPPKGQRATNTHVRVLGRANQRFALLFRDYLRAHAPTAEAYAELKRRLAQQLPGLQHYTDVKDPAVDLIYFAAEDWAAASGWVLGPSDA